MSPAILALVAVLVWGASFAMTKVALEEVSVPTILFARSALGLGFVLPWLAARGEARGIRREDLGELAALCALGNVVPQLLQGQALVWSTAASTAWLVALIPVVTAILARPLLGESLAGKGAGILLAFAGTLLVVSGGASLTAVLGLPSTRGDAMTLASTVSWTLFTIRGRVFLARYPPVATIVWLIATSLFMLGPSFLLAGGPAELRSLSVGGWGAVLYLGIGCSGLGFTLWYTALERMEASRLAAFIYLEPLVAQVVAAALIAEPLRPTTLVGGAAILAGVWRVSRAPETAAEPAAGELSA